MSMFLNATADINTYIDQANAVIRGNYNAATGKAGVSQSGVKVMNPDTFYTKQLLDTIRVEQDEYKYFRYADAQPMTGKANKLQIRRWAPLEAHTQPLLEGVPPTSDKGSVEYYEISTAQYGRYMEFTDKVDFKFVDPVIAHYAAEYSIVAVETLDMLAREALFLIANTVYAGYVKNFEALTVESKPSMTDLRKIVLSLKKRLVKPRTNGRYHVIAGPEFFFDMITDPTVEQYMKINQTTKTMYDNSMLVPMFNLEFYETLVCPTHGKFTKMISDVSRDCLRIVSKETDGTYKYATLVAAIYGANGTTVTTAGTKYYDGSASKEIFTYVDGYVKDSRTGQDASYIPHRGVWNLDGFNAEANKYNASSNANGTNGASAVTGDATAGNTWYEFNAQHVLVLGKDALIRTGIEGEDQARMYTKPLGSSGVLDPIDQRQSIGFKINDVGFGSARLEAVVDYICVPSQCNII